MSIPQGYPDPLPRHPGHHLPAGGHGDADADVHEERQGVREQGRAPGHHWQDLLLASSAVRRTSNIE